MISRGPFLKIDKTNTHLKNRLAGLLDKRSIYNEPFAIPFEPEIFPLSVRSLFPDARQIFLEIGSGYGEFTRENALRNPAAGIIALEKKRHRIAGSIREQKVMGLQNIRWMVVDINWFFDEIFEDNSFDRIIINFPDPWPKKRHHKNRFISNALLSSLSRMSKPDALLEFATDYFPYLSDTLSILEISPQWKNMHGRGRILSTIPGRPVSFFEQQKRDENLPVYFLQFVHARG